MGTILKFLVAIPAILFTAFGLRWAVDPGGAATQFGMPLLDGLGLSTQAGDLTAFFLGLGIFIFAGLIKLLLFTRGPRKPSSKVLKELSSILTVHVCVHF